MYVEHGNIDTPPDDTVVWRYMNLEKLLALLGSSSLHLCRLDDLRDPWEGKWSPAALEAFRGGAPLNIAPSIVESAARILNMGLGKYYVNCWHESPSQSAAFWDQYQHFCGVAVRSTIGRLKKSKGLAPTFFIGRVRYPNYENPESVEAFFASGSVNSLIPVFLKRKSFEYEHEVRVVVWSGTEEEERAELNLAAPTTKSFKIPIDLGELIDAIFLCPTSEPWLVDPIKELLKRFCLPSVPVIRSDLYDKNIL
jgi:hypothetical protein